MNTRPCLLSLAWLAGVAAGVFGQGLVNPFGGPVPPQPPPALNGTAPLLHVRFLGPPGMHVTLYRGLLNDRTFAVPVNVALRPGYVYRIALTGLPGHPETALFPTLEVRGTLRLPPRVKAADYPAPILLTEDDIEQVLAGSLITKVVYLEHPDKAIPAAGDPDLPGETTLPSGRDLLAESRELGRPVLVLRLGQREFTPEELAEQSIAGTILLPGETTLPWPRKGPVIPPITWPWYDPFHGPRPPEEEYLHNGYINPNRGALGPATAGSATGPGLDNSGQLQGLRSEDTVAEFTDGAGQRRLVASNRVCLYVPRWALLRSECPLGQYDAVVGLETTRAARIQDQLRLGLPPGHMRQQDHLTGVLARQRASGMQGKESLSRLLDLQVLDGTHVFLNSNEVLSLKPLYQLTDIERARLARQVLLAQLLSGTERVGEVENTIVASVVGRVDRGPEVVRATAEVQDLTTVCSKEPPHVPEKPLVLIKWTDRESAKVGDVVTFFLRYSNQGHKPITDVAVTDSLATRLEYIAGSSQSNRPAVFTTQENEAGSLVLRWEITGALQPGETGVVRFQARVR